MIRLIGALSEPFYIFDWVGVLEGGVNFATCIFIIGGIFIIYTAVKEISHMLTIHNLSTDVDGKREICGSSRPLDRAHEFNLFL